MAKIEGGFRCPCSKEMKYIFKKPSVIEPTTTSVECPECKSRFQLRNSKRRGLKPMETVVEQRTIYVSPKCREIIQQAQCDEIQKPRKVSNPYDRMG